MKKSFFAFLFAGAALSLLGCMTQPTTSPSNAEATSAPKGLQMSDTLGAVAPEVTLTGTWAVRQINKNGQVYLGSISFLQVGKLLIGRADWENHPDGHLLGWVSSDRVAFGQGFTDTSKANLLGFYSARFADGGDSLVQGATYSNGNDSGTFVAARVSDCPALPLTPTPLTCQQAIDSTETELSLECNFPDIDTSLASTDSLSPLSGCWAITQINAGVTYRGTMVLNVDQGAVTGKALWTNHPGGTLSGTVKMKVFGSLPSPPPTYQIDLIQSFTGAKSGLKGHYTGTLLANGTLSGSAFATQDGIPNGDSSTWTGMRIQCPDED
jgi:hypothetical protein